MTKSKPSPKDPTEELFVRFRMDLHQADHGYYSEYAEKQLRELWAGMTKAERCKYLALDEAIRILSKFPDTPKHSLNEPSDCLAGQVQRFLKETCGADYTKKHIAERFLKYL